MVKDSETGEFGNYDFSQKNQNFEWKTMMSHAGILLIFCQSCDKIITGYPFSCTKYSYHTKRNLSSEFSKRE